MIHCLSTIYKLKDFLESASKFFHFFYKKYLLWYYIFHKQLIGRLLLHDRAINSVIKLTIRKIDFHDKILVFTCAVFWCHNSETNQRQYNEPYIYCYTPEENWFLIHYYAFDICQNMVYRPDEIILTLDFVLGRYSLTRSIKPCGIHQLIRF